MHCQYHLTETAAAQGGPPHWLSIPCCTTVVQVCNGEDMVSQGERKSHKSSFEEDLLKDGDIVIVNLLLLVSICHSLIRRPSLDGGQHGFFLLADLHAACWAWCMLDMALACCGKYGRPFTGEVEACLLCMPADSSLQLCFRIVFSLLLLHGTSLGVLISLLQSAEEQAPYIGEECFRLKTSHLGQRYVGDKPGEEV